MLELARSGLSRVQLFAVAAAFAVVSALASPMAMAQTTIETDEVTTFPPLMLPAPSLSRALARTRYTAALPPF